MVKATTRLLGLDGLAVVGVEDGMAGPFVHLVTAGERGPAVSGLWHPGAPVEGAAGDSASRPACGRSAAAAGVGEAAVVL